MYHPSMVCSQAKETLCLADWTTALLGKKQRTRIAVELKWRINRDWSLLLHHPACECYRFRHFPVEPSGDLSYSLTVYDVGIVGRGWMLSAVRFPS